MKEPWSRVPKVHLKDFGGYNLIGKGADGSVFQLTPDRCIKVFVNEKTKDQELNAIQLGQSSPVITRLYEHGSNYIIMEYVKGISLPQYLKKEKQLPESIVKKILFLFEELEKIGFKRIDAEIRHILFNEAMEIKVIDLKRALTSDRNVPTKLLSGLEKRGFLNEFYKHVNTLNPSLYQEWKKKTK